MDSFHTYCSGDSLKDLAFLKANDIVSVQVNDGVIGRTADTQIDQERELPGDTGLIDLKRFLNTVKSTGYSGAVSVEPFNKMVNQMDTISKLKRIRASLKKIGLK